MAEMRPWQANRIAERQRRVKQVTCQRCGAGILCGLDADDVAMTARVDPAPVSRAAELAHLAAGGRSYDLHKAALYARYPHHYLNETQWWDVLLSHVCDRKGLGG